MSARLPQQKKKREEDSNECKVVIAKKKGEEDHNEWGVTGFDPSWSTFLRYCDVSKKTSV